MVIGESRFYTLEPQVGVDITQYTAKWDLLKGKTVVRSGVPTNDGTKFSIKIQTDGLFAGNYETRVYITDPVDGFIYADRDEFVLEA